MIDDEATVLQRLQVAGAVLVAKLSMIELAGGFGYRQADASFTGPGRNGWNRERWAGGSSSGPGSAVAAGLVPFAIGSETSGSIMTPAGYNGLSGFRPTYGRVSRAGAMSLVVDARQNRPDVSHGTRLRAGVARDCRGRSRVIRHVSTNPTSILQHLLHSAGGSLRSREHSTGYSPRCVRISWRR